MDYVVVLQEIFAAAQALVILPLDGEVFRVCLVEMIESLHVVVADPQVVHGS